MKVTSMSPQKIVLDHNMELTKKELGPLTHIIFLLGRIGVVNEYKEIEVDPSFEVLILEAAKRTGKTIYARHALQYAAYAQNPLEEIKATERHLKMLDKYWDLISRGKRIDTTVTASSIRLTGEATMTVDPVPSRHMMIVSLLANGASLIVKMPITENTVIKIFLDCKYLFDCGVRMGAMINGETVKPTKHYQFEKFMEHNEISDKLITAFQLNIPYSAVTALNR